jgi:regulator of protease activity HflC (stomatin/prohibitin superfamily)
MEDMETKTVRNWIIGIVVTVLVLIATGMAVTPSYRIYKQNKQGEANLRQQEWEKKILVEQAKAQNESATLNAEATIKQETAKAEAEVIRARGVAEANKIIGESLKGNEEYLNYLWINNIEKTGSEKIYIPTEAGMPILEARNN